MKSEVVLYGSNACHKTKYYMDYLSKIKIEYVFYDVIKDIDSAADLRRLYETDKLNFPTILIGDKKLRNPSDNDLNRWLAKKIIN
tara:strand:- start:1992 stop:2246 length:255 start_codon:yes stop_codon:yes gene_type:complete